MKWEQLIKNLRFSNPVQNELISSRFYRLTSVHEVNNVSQQIYPACPVAKAFGVECRACSTGAQVTQLPITQ